MPHVINSYPPTAEATRPRNLYDQNIMSSIFFGKQNAKRKRRRREQTRDHYAVGLCPDMLFAPTRGYSFRLAQDVRSIISQRRLDLFSSGILKNCKRIAIAHTEQR